MSEKRKDQDWSTRLQELSAVRRREGQDGARKEKRSLTLKRLRVAEDSCGAGDANHIFAEHENFAHCLAEVAAGSVHNVMCTLRRLVCSSNVPIQELIDAGVVPHLVAALRCPDEKVRSDALWCLTNIATGNHDQTAHVLQAAPEFLHLLSSGDVTLQEQACWAIGNIAGDSYEFRGVLIANGALAPLLSFLERSVAPGTHGSAAATTRAQTAAWAVSNLARGSPASAEAFISSGYVPMLISLTAYGDAIVATEMWWLFYYLSGPGKNDAVTYMLECGLANAAIAAISKTNPADIISIPVVRTVGNLSGGQTEWLDQLLLVGSANHNPKHSLFFLALENLLVAESAHKSVVKESLWVLGNIFAGSESARVKALEAGMLSRVFELIMYDEFDIQREAICALRNACVQPETVALILSQGGHIVVSQLVRLLRTFDSEVTLACILILRAIALASSSASRSQVVDLYNSLELYDILEELQYGNSPQEVREAAVLLIVEVFEHEVDENVQVSDESSVPVVNTLQQSMGRGRHLSAPSWL